MWFLITVLATLFYGVLPVFNNKAVGMHGKMINIGIFTIIYFIFLVICFPYFKNDLQLVTKKSLTISIIAGIIAFSGNVLIFYAYQLAPQKLAVIMVTFGFSMVIVAIISHFLGSRLALHQWGGVALALIGIALVNLDKTAVKTFLLWIK